MRWFESIRGTVSDPRWSGNQIGLLSRSRTKVGLMQKNDFVPFVAFAAKWNLERYHVVSDQPGDRDENCEDVDQLMNMSARPDLLEQQPQASRVRPW